MPIGEFQCENCGNKFELTYQIRDSITDFTKCPKCGELAGRKPSLFEFIIKKE